MDMALRMLPIARPCTGSFAAMRGDDRTRFCDACRKEVHDLSARTEEEARALLAAARGARLCVRFARDARGDVRFRAAATLAAAVSLAACSSPVAATTPPETPTVDLYELGDVVPDEVDRCPDDPAAADPATGCPGPGADADGGAATPPSSASSGG